MNIQIIVGSVREKRVAILVADWIKAMLDTFEAATIEIIDLKEWKLPMYEGAPPLALKRQYTDSLQEKWSDKILQGDAYILISPEYNHGYTPALKNALDYLGSEWSNKPVAFVSYGSTFGSRSIEHLRCVTTQLGLIDSNLTLEIRDMSARSKNNSFEGNEVEQKLILSIAEKLVNLAKKLSA